MLGGQGAENDCQFVCPVPIRSVVKVERLPSSAWMRTLSIPWYEDLRRLSAGRQTFALAQLEFEKGDSEGRGRVFVRRFVRNSGIGRAS